MYGRGCCGAKPLLHITHFPLSCRYDILQSALFGDKVLVNLKRSGGCPGSGLSFLTLLTDTHPPAQRLCTKVINNYLQIYICEIKIYNVIFQNQKWSYN